MKFSSQSQDSEIHNIKSMWSRAIGVYEGAFFIFLKETLDMNREASGLLVWNDPIRL